MSLEQILNWQQISTLKMMLKNNEFDDLVAYVATATDLEEANEMLYEEAMVFGFALVLNKDWLHP